ncbi:MAG: hypothetical protein L6300_09335 [Syntrophaceae bacterium]|nr:hypothetical protein [Syntrophaceae bacterium]
MRYLGIVEKRHGGQIILESFGQEKITKEDDPAAFEAVEIEGAVVLVPAPVDRKRLAQIATLTSQSIHDHRTTLEGLAR